MNKQEKKLYNKNYRQQNREQLLKQKNNYYQLNKKLISKNRKEKYQINKEKLNKHRRKMYLKNRLIILSYQKNWQKIHRMEKRKYQQNYMRNRRRIDINFRITNYLRHRIWCALKGNPKLSITMKLVGCSIDKLKEHLQKHFKSDMSFSNYGKWHIDHIKPCASFDLRKKSEQRKCFNYKNLQPLWAKENLSKGRN